MGTEWLLGRSAEGWVVLSAFPRAVMWAVMWAVLWAP